MSESETTTVDKDLYAGYLTGCERVFHEWELNCTQLEISLPDLPLISSQVWEEELLIAAISGMIEGVVAKICGGRLPNASSPPKNRLIISWSREGAVSVWWYGTPTDRLLDLRAILLECAQTTFGQRCEAALMQLRDTILGLVLRGQFDLYPLERQPESSGPCIHYVLPPDTPLC